MNAFLSSSIFLFCSLCPLEAQSNPPLLWITLHSSACPYQGKQLPSSSSSLLSHRSSCLTHSFLWLHKSSQYKPRHLLSWHTSHGFVIALLTCLSLPIYSDSPERCILRLSQISRFLNNFFFSSF